MTVNRTIRAPWVMSGRSIAQDINVKMVPSGIGRSQSAGIFGTKSGGRLEAFSWYGLVVNLTPSLLPWWFTPTRVFIC